MVIMRILTDLFNRVKGVKGGGADSEIDGLDIMKNLPAKQSQAILKFMVEYVMMECRFGLGMIDDIPDDLPDELPFFNAINAVYRERDKGCYFCDKTIDPNGAGMSKSTELCIDCMLKLGNFVQALGIPPDMIFRGMRWNKNQLSAIKLMGGALEVKIDPKEIDLKEGEDGRYREKFKRDEKNLHDVQTLQ